MALRKCPRCEINYILDEGDLCTVCFEALHGRVKRERPPVFCTVCGEKPAVRGEEMCRGCMAEIRSLEMNDTDGDQDELTVADLEADTADDLDEFDDLDGDDAYEAEEDYALEDASGAK